jgi:hypothetical protein
VVDSGPRADDGPNDEANYYWAVAGDASYVTLDPATSGLEFQLSAQIGYRAEPWVEPPAAAVLTLVARFTQDVTLANLNEPWSVTPGVGESATVFTFDAAGPAYGPDLTGDFHGAEAGEIDVSIQMSLTNAGDTTWAQEPGEDDAVLVA